MSESVYPDPVLFGSDEDKRVIEIVRKSYRDADRFRQPIKKKWDYHFSLLNGVSRGQQQAWQTDRFINLTRVASMLLKSRFYQGMPVGQAEGRTLEASLNQDAMNDVLKYDQDRAHLEKALGNVIDDGINYACGIIKSGWRTETAENIPRTASFLEKMVTAVKKLIPGFKKTQILYDGPTFDWVDPWTFRWDPNGVDVDDCGYVIESTDETVYQLRKDPSIDPHVITKIAEYQNTTADLKKDIRDRMAALGLTATEANRIYGKIKDGLHEKHLYWGSYDIDGDGIEEECKIIVIDWMFVGVCEENQFWHGKKPYDKWDFNSNPGFFVGHSLVDQASQSQEEINDLTNQLGDVRKLTLKPVIKFRLGADVEPETLRTAPGMLWGLENVDDVVIEQPPTGSISGILEVLKYEREVFQLLTGMNDVVLGEQDVGIGDNTATGAAIAQEQTELRYKAPAVGLDLFMESVGDKLIWNEQQFRNRKEIVPVRSQNDVKYKTIAPKDLSGLFSYRMISSSLALQSPSMRINNLLKALEITQGDPNYDQTKIKDQILEQIDLDPASFKVVQTGNMDALSQFKALPQDQQQEALAKMSPEDQQLIQKALTMQDANTPSAPQPVPQGGQITGGIPSGIPQSAPQPSSVGTVN